MSEPDRAALLSDYRDAVVERSEEKRNRIAVTALMKAGWSWSRCSCRCGGQWTWTKPKYPDDYDGVRVIWGCICHQEPFSLLEHYLDELTTPAPREGSVDE